MVYVGESSRASPSKGTRSVSSHALRWSVNGAGRAAAELYTSHPVTCHGQYMPLENTAREMETYGIHRRLVHITKHVRVHHSNNGKVLRGGWLGSEEHRVPLSDSNIQLVRVVRHRPHTICFDHRHHMLVEL